MTAEMGHNSRAFCEDLFQAAANSVKPADQEAIRFLYVPMHVGDWVSGTLGLSIELEGAYCRFIVRLYERGKAFPDDDRILSTCMGLSIRVWKRVKQALIDLGKIVIRNGCLTNSRFEKERRKRAETLRKQAESARKRHERERQQKRSLPEVSPKLSPNFDETSPKHSDSMSKKSNKINELEVRPLGNPESKNPISYKKEETLVSNSRLSDSELMDRLSAAAGACLKNPAASPGLLVLSEPRRWLEQGCDLETDVIPAIKAVAAKRPMRSVGGWGYFTSAILEARAKRTTPLPQVDREAVADAKRIEREKMIRSRAAIMGVSPDVYRERLAKIEASL